MASPFLNPDQYGTSLWRLFSSYRFDICRNGRCIITIAIATGLCLQQFCAHMTGAFATLRRAAMETEDFRRTCRPALLGGMADVFFLERITNADIHGAIAISY